MRIFLFLALLGGAAAQEPKPCPFCEIIAGTRQQEGVVYRGDKVVAFLSIGPRNPGHLLIVPVVHAENFLEIPADTMHAMTDAAKKLAAAIKRTDLKMEGFVLQMNNGKAANQTVFHAHLHLIPRYTGDEARAPSGQGSSQPPQKAPEERVPMAELAPVAAKIRAALAQR